MKGIAAIRGEKLPRIDQEYFYEVASFYPGTVVGNDQDIKWKLFTQEESGRWRELRGTLKRGRRVSFKFPQQWYGKKLLVEAFINNPEIKEPPGMIIMPVPGERSIKRISILDRNGQRFTQPPKYGQTIMVEIETVNMLGETLSVGLWERDTMASTGHSAADNENIWGTDKTYKVTENNGILTFSFVLDAAWAIKANRSLFEGSTHEYYLLVKGYGAGTKYSHQQEVTDAVVRAENNATPQGGRAAPKQNRLPAQPAPVPQTPAGGQNPPVPANRTPAPASQTPVTPAPQVPNTPATVPATPQTPPTTPVQQQATIPASGLGADPAPVAGGKSTTTVEEEKVEGLTDAYFAKKEFTKKTGENAATFEYEIKSNGNKTGTAAEKKKIAGIILNKAEVKALSAKKEYTTEDAIIQALTKNVYNDGDKVSFQTFKLGPEFKRIPSAPLEDKVYLVATGYLLDGKQATITIKEKDGILKGAPDAVLSVFEITEQQMDDPKAEITGTEKSTFTGTIQDGMVKIPVQLRPKEDEELKQWKEKLSQGKEDGTYTYTFNNEGGTQISADNKSRLAAIIVDNAKGGLRGNTKIEDGKTAYAKDVEAVLEIKTYSKGEQITFKLYKKIPELLYLRAQAQGERQHDKEFLKKDGAYFLIGKKCPRCEAEITLADIEAAFTVYSNQKDFRQKVVDSLNKFIKQRKAEGKDLHLNTCLRKAHFFAQVATETLGIHGDWTVEGTMNHSVESAKSAFGQRARDLESAGLLARYCRERPQTSLYNYMYAKGNGFDNGNGVESTGDGWKYRGRGLKQITGRGNYNMISGVLKEIFPEEYNKLPAANAGEERLESHPEKVEEIDYAVTTAIAYWEKHKIWELADTITSKSSSDNDFKKIRQKVVGESGFKWKVAKEYFQKTYDAFKVGECQKGDAQEACTPDCSQCFNYADVWENPVISSDNGGRNNNRYGHGSSRGHKGVDILTGGTYKDVHSLMCGEVTAVVDSFATNEYRRSSLGNTVMIKSKDKDNKTVFILYCHLDSVDVKVGDKVQHGKKIALSGSTGNAAEILDARGNLVSGIRKENWHVHIEAATMGDGHNNFYSLGSYRIQPEDYMKTKFDANGNVIQ